MKRSDLEVVHIKKGFDHSCPHLNVYNNLTEQMRNIAAKMPLLELANAVLASQQKDQSRGNKCIDVGFASDVNSKRNDEWGGLQSLIH
jgi:hypothetical protein